MVYLISYDLKKSIQEYQELYQELKKSGTWWHHLDSTWLVVTSETTNQLYERIKAKIDNDDNFIIFNITANKNNQGWLPKKAWAWIEKNIDK